jgi:tetratricopeptide (TPR) repeat protein
MVCEDHDIVGEGFVLHTIGLARAKLGRRDDAKALLHKAINLQEMIMDHLRLRACTDLAPLLAQDGQHAQAVNLAEHALSTFDERRAATLSNQPANYLSR